jgi:YVTN family beta-propeller protein
MRKYNFSNTLLLTVLLSLLFVMLSCGGGGGGGGGAWVPSDTTAPVTAALPAGGVFGTLQNVTLTANEVSTIYYSLDGTDPSIGGSNTIAGSSPVQVQLAAGTTVLKFFAVDASGNREVMKSYSYLIDLVAPTISLNSSAPSPFGLLASQTISWKSDEGGRYTVELGGTGTVGSGTQLARGTVAANTPIDQIIKGAQLKFSAPTPLWIYVTDQVGHTGSFSLNLDMKQLVVIPGVGAGLWEIAILSNGKKAYVANESNTVTVIDTDPVSNKFNTVTATIPVANRAHGLAITPDGSRVYVTNQGRTILDINYVSVIDTTTDQVTATISLGSKVPGGIAISIDGKMGYFTSADGYIYVLDTDSNSSGFNSIIGSIQRPLINYGEIAMTPDGKKAIVSWTGMISHGVDVLDVDPQSSTYNTIISSPVPIVSAPGGDVAVSPDGAFAFATDGNNQLCKIDLQTYAITLTYSGTFSTYGGISLTPDGLNLLTSNFNDTKLYLMNTSYLTPIGDVDLGSNLGNYLVVTPDGTRAYVERNPVSMNGEVVMVPL